MARFALFLALGLSFATAAMADRRITMVIGTDDPAAVTSCTLTFFSKGWMNFSKDIDRGGAQLKSTGSIDLPDERVQQFDAAAKDLLNRALPDVADDSPAGFVRVEYLEGEAGAFELERLVIRPKLDIPPVLIALFGPLDDGICLGP